MPTASASITKLALVLIQEQINKQKLNANIIAVIHDEILVQCHKDIVDNMKNIVSSKMIEAFNYYCPGLVMKVNPEIDNHWVH